MVTVGGDFLLADRHALRMLRSTVKVLQHIGSLGERRMPKFRRDFRIYPLIQHPHASPFVKVLQGGLAVSVAKERVLIL